MTVFAVVYFGTALAVTAAVYFMSLFATRCLEAKYGFTRLKSTAIAVLILLMIYLADTFGSKKAKKNE